MAQPQLGQVVGHWSKLVEGFQTSPLEFYRAVETGLVQRQIPGLRTERVNWSEGGVLAPDREYLRVSGGRYRFDVCAAPFGTGFFFSTWMTERRPRYVILHLVVLAVLSLVFAWMLQKTTLAFLGTFANSPLDLLAYGLAAFIGPFLMVPLGILVSMWVVAMAARMAIYDPELVLMSLPILGAVYRYYFAPDTYYRVDTQQMFNTAIHAAVLEAIDSQTAQKGLRSLAEDERKPIFQKLA